MSALFSLAHATAIDDPEFGHFEPNPETGGFDLPDELADRQRKYCPGGRKLWETEEERGRRMLAEDSAHRRDPATLYDAVEQIAGLTRLLAEAQIQAQGRQADPAPGQAAAIADLQAEVEKLRAASDAADGHAGTPAAEAAKTTTTRGKKPAADAQA